MFLILLFVVYIESFLYSMRLLLFFLYGLFGLMGLTLLYSTLLYSPLLPLNLNKPIMLPWLRLFPSTLFFLVYLMEISSSKQTISCSNTFSQREATLFKNSGFLSRQGIQSHWYKLLFFNENEDHHALWFEKMLILVGVDKYLFIVTTLS